MKRVAWVSRKGMQRRPGHGERGKVDTFTLLRLLRSVGCKVRLNMHLWPSVSGEAPLWYEDMHMSPVAPVLNSAFGILCSFGVEFKIAFHLQNSCLILNSNFRFVTQNCGNLCFVVNMDAVY